MDNDDKPIGRVLTRREMLALLGGSGAALLAGLTLPKLAAAQEATATAEAVALPACVARPELTEGPYFVDGQLNRYDIRVDPSDNSIKEGTPLKLTYRVSDVTGGVCAPLAGATVDVWHCDADGVYSGVSDPGFDTSGQYWLRGNQVTDENGFAEFLTIVPGWYSGRAVHIHFKIRIEGTDAYEFTSQLFFDPDQIEEVYAVEPYAAKGSPDVPNEQDAIYQQSGGVLTIDLVPMDAADLETIGAEQGYTAVFEVGLDLSDTSVGASDSASAGGNGGRPGGAPPRRP